MKKIGARILAAILTIILILPTATVFATSEAVTVNMLCNDNAKAGEVITLCITIDKPTVALAGLEFALEYDSAMVIPQITDGKEDGSGFDVFVKKRPTDWEQMTSHIANESKYRFRFALPESENTLLTEKNGLSLEIPFLVRAPGVVSFKIASSDIIAIAADESFSVLGGKGSEFSTVASGTSEKLAVELGETEVAFENGLYYLNLDAINLGDDEGLVGLEFALSYDPSVFAPVITKNDNLQMDAFIVSAPQNAWEQMCTLKPSESKLILRFAALHAESTTDCEKLNSGESIKIKVPFRVVGKEGDSATFITESASAIGVNNKTQKILGRGDIKSVSVSKGSYSLPDGIYETDGEHLLYVAEKTLVKDFLAGLGEVELLNDGTRVTDGFVKTGFTLAGDAVFLTVVVKGDINCSGEIDSMDYIITKRVYYNTFQPTKTQLLAVAITNKETVESLDYVLIKRHYFGTYNINK